MIKFNFKIIIIVAITVFFASSDVFAAEVIMKPVSNLSNDGAAIVDVLIKPENENINFVEGIIRLESHNDTSVVVETGGSMLTLWTSTPKYNSDEKIIRFAGGTPNGFDKEGVLLRIRLSEPSSDTLKLSLIGASAYLNDGKGTKKSLSARSVTISLNGQVPGVLPKTTRDNTPPQFEYIEFGRDPSIHDGQYFVSFFATDNISGVDHYEVKEGQNISEVRQGDVYVIRDQSLGTQVYVTAVDQAGNKKTVKALHEIHWWRIISLLIVVAIVYYLLRKKNIKLF